MEIEERECRSFLMLLAIFFLGLFLSTLSFLSAKSNFWLCIIITILFILMPIHELGHFLSAKNLNYKPSAIVLSLFFVPRGVVTIEGKNDNKRKLHKFTGLFSTLFIIPFLIFFWKIFSVPNYNIIQFWIAYLALATGHALHDILGFYRLISNKESEKEKKEHFENRLFSSIIEKMSRIDEILPDLIYVTSKDNWNLWKERYQENYEDLVKGQTVIFDS